jgi:hypothetical protein
LFKINNSKISLFCGCIVTNDEPILLTIEGKWLEAIMHMIEFKFLDFPSPKQVQFFISIHIYSKFCLLITSALIGFQEDIQQFIPQVKIGLKGKTFVTPLTIIPNDNVQWNVKCKLDFVESKSISKQKPSSTLKLLIVFM